MAKFYAFYPPSGGSGTNASIGLNGAPAPTSSTEVGGVGPDGNLHPIATDNSGNQNVNVISSALPTGAATAANQATEITSLQSIQASNTNIQTSTASIDAKTPALGQQLAAASQPVVLTAAQIATLTPLTSVTVTQATGTNLHAVIDSGTVTVTQATGTNLHTVVDASALPTGAATETTLAAINTKTPALGSATSANSTPVVLASDSPTLPVMAPDLVIVGAAAQTVSGNDILLATAGTAAVDLLNYKSGLVQVVSTATAGTILFEGSNDNVNFQTVPVFNQIAAGGTTPTLSPITATVSQIGYTFAVQFRYLRLRIATTITGGTVQAYSRFSQAPWSNTGVMNTTVSGSLTNITGTVSLPTGAATSANQATEITSLASIVTNTARTPAQGAAVTAASTPVNIASDQVVPVKAATGTLTDGSGSTSATPSTSTQVFAANATRKYLLIQNLSTSTNIYINFTSAATATSGSIVLLPSGSFVQEANYVSTEVVTVLSTGASVPFTAKQG